MEDLLWRAGDDFRRGFRGGGLLNLNLPVFILRDQRAVREEVLGRRARVRRISNKCKHIVNSLALDLRWTPRFSLNRNFKLIVANIPLISARVQNAALPARTASDHIRQRITPGLSKQALSR